MNSFVEISDTLHFESLYLSLESVKNYVILHQAF